VHNRESDGGESHGASEHRGVRASGRGVIEHTRLEAPHFVGGAPVIELFVALDIEIGHPRARRVGGDEILHGGAVSPWRPVLWVPGERDNDGDDRQYGR
jgi:hypothetical protein